MTATQALTEDLKKQVIALENDLRRRVEDDQAVLGEWQRAHRQATEKDRTAWSWTQWRDDRVNQTAVAWVLMSVFIRFCEDNALVKPVWITGPGRRRQEALDAELAFFREHGTWTEREWLEDAIAYLGKLPATKALVDSHSALRYASPSGSAVEDLIKFWRNRSDDGKLVHDLQDETLSTRFLGDLYQNLSKYAQDTYALLQTPVFVEEQILNWTLEPALQERPLETFRMIDPTCGSGHFLIGSFKRLLDRWHRQAPAMEIQARVQSALNAIHGVDLNSFAVAIARFRLTVAALQACDLRSLENAPAFKYHLAVGDSLIHGPDLNVLPGMEKRCAFMPFHYVTEDSQLLLEILQERRYDAVVGNPPYITAKDPALNKIYRSKFGKVCKGTYALTVPFMIQFFALAKRGDESGWVGMITSNSFMKREFGVPLIETYLPTVDLRLVVDSEGAWIPGHNTDGTPTVIVVGRNQLPDQSTVRAILSKGIRETREHGSEGSGPYWSAIVTHWNEPGWGNDWIAVADLDRSTLSSHPWNLAGGEIAGAIAAIFAGSKQNLKSLVTRIGFFADSHADEAFFLNPSFLSRLNIPNAYRKETVRGSEVRNWGTTNGGNAIFPYTSTRELASLGDLGMPCKRYLWKLRTTLGNRSTFSGATYLADGRPWYSWHQLPKDLTAHSWSIVFAEIASHAHFSVNDSDVIFNRTAPIIKLPANASEDTHFGIAGALNSSVGCFWLRQMCKQKGGAAGLSWSRTFQFNGKKIAEFPLPLAMPIEKAALLARMAEERRKNSPGFICSSNFPSRDPLSKAHGIFAQVTANMVFMQEELDWEIYKAYGLIEDDLTYMIGDLSALKPGERAFEICLAESASRDKETSEWFREHSATPIPRIPQYWPNAYQEIVSRRLALIRDNPIIRLLERPEYKRRWSQDPAWEKLQEKALRGWLLDRIEDRRFWFDAAGGAEPKSVGQLADEVSRDPDVVSVLALWQGRPDVPVSDSLKKLLSEEAVPFLAAYRYATSGLRKREAWEETWRKQRREDIGEHVGVIPSPPKYASSDFAEEPYARLRGELDTPKERFILYPDANRQGDPTMLLGWAGWDHAEQSLALSRIIGEREQEGWDDERLVPLVAGLAELQPWVEQWHSGVDERYGVSLAAFCQEQLDQRAAQVGKTRAELAAWRPTPSGRGRKPRAKGGVQ